MRTLIILIVLFLYCAFPTNGATIHNSPCVESITFNTQSKTIDITLANLIEGETYQLYSITNNYTFTFKASNVTHTLSLIPNTDQDAFKVKRMKNLTFLTSCLIIA